MFRIFALSIMVLAIVGCSDPEPQVIDMDEVAAEAGFAPEDYTVHENGAMEIHSKVQDKTFGITPDELGSRLSAEAKDVGLGDIPFDNFDLEKGSVNDVFIVKISDAIAMNGTVDKNGELKATTFIMGSSENGDTEIMSMLMMAGLTARALSPDLAKEETAGAVTELVVEVMNGFEKNGKGKASQVVDGIKYGVTADNILGLWISFEPA